jgi:hypothetical protein
VALKPQLVNQAAQVNLKANQAPAAAVDSSPTQPLLHVLPRRA